MKGGIACCLPRCASRDETHELEYKENERLGRRKFGEALLLRSILLDLARSLSLLRQRDEREDETKNIAIP